MHYLLTLLPQQYDQHSLRVLQHRCFVRVPGSQEGSIKPMSDLDDSSYQCHVDTANSSIPGRAVQISRSFVLTGDGEYSCLDVL